MIISLSKFGTMLISRQDGREALLAFNSTLRDVGPDEKIEIDFAGVEVLTPSWVDEFLTPIFNSFKNRISLINAQNSSVIESLKILNLKF